MSFNRETGGRFFSPDNQAGRAPELPASTRFDRARTIIESKHAKLDGAHIQTAIDIQQAVAELLPPFQERDDVPKIIYITSFNDLPRSIADGLVIENGTKDENRSDEALSIIELDLASGKLYKAERGFTDFTMCDIPYSDSHTYGAVSIVGAKKTVTLSRTELGTQGWLDFGGKAVDALQKVAKTIEKGKRYNNPRHRLYRGLKLVPDDPNPEPKNPGEPDEWAKELTEELTGRPWD